MANARPMVSPPAEILQRHAVIIALLLGLAALTSDYLTGPSFQIPGALVFPVALVSWYRTWWMGVVFAVGLSGLRFGLPWLWEPPLPGPLVYASLNALTRGVLLSVTAYFVARHRRLHQDVRVLRGILPICSFCHKIRDTQGQWETLERYVRSHSEADFSHSVCPACAREHYGEFLRGPDRARDE